MPHREPSANPPIRKQGEVQARQELGERLSGRGGVAWVARHEPPRTSEMGVLFASQVHSRPTMIHDGSAVVRSFVAAGHVLGTPLEPERLLEFSTEPSKFSRRDFEPGHFTVSAVLADGEANQVFLIYHPKLKRWLQPGVISKRRISR